MVAMGKVFNMDPSYINAAAVVANLFVAVMLLVYNMLSVSKWARKNYPHPHIDAYEANAETGKSLAEQYWKPRAISLRDIALTMATGVVITGVSQYICQLIAGTTLGPNVKMVVGNVYLVMTTITLILVSIFPKYFNNLGGAEEIGNFMIMLFFVSLGLTADIGLFVAVGPVIIVTAILIILFNLGLVLTAGKLFKWNIEEIISCSNATIGGPTTAAAFAISKGWTNLVAPGILIGLYGYAIGNYAGVLVASLIGL